jgi:hypothetical protein
MCKKKLLIVLFVALIIAGLVGPAQAFELGATDGVWKAASPSGTPADYYYYHSGPMPSADESHIAFDKTNYYSNSYMSQSSNTAETCFKRTSASYPAEGEEVTEPRPFNDWNSVSFGFEPYGTGDISEPSRFAWLGNLEPIGANIELNKLFLVGKFCHVNNPIPSTRVMQSVPLELTINGVTCDPGWKLEEGTGYVDSRNITFSYQFLMDETLNAQGTCTSTQYKNGIDDCYCKKKIYNSWGWHIRTDYYKSCKYRPGSLGWPTNGGGGCTEGQESSDNYFGWPNPVEGHLNYNGCADKISMTVDNATTYFTCVNLENPTIKKKYTVSMLGTMPAPSNTPADDCPQTASSSQVGFNVGFTSEKAITCMCAYGAITESNLTPVEIINFMALGSSEGIKLSWETTAETDNLGFNIYRSTSLDGERELVNETVIISDSPGGGMGATYEYMDMTVPAGVTYYYWLRDIPLDDTIEPVDFGPLEALRPLN